MALLHDEESIWAMLQAPQWSRPLQCWVAGCRILFASVERRMLSNSSTGGRNQAWTISMSIQNSMAPPLRGLCSVPVVGFLPPAFYGQSWCRSINGKSARRVDANHNGAGSTQSLVPHPLATNGGGWPHGPAVPARGRKRAFSTASILSRPPLSRLGVPVSPQRPNWQICCAAAGLPAQNKPTFRARNAKMGRDASVTFP